VQIAKADGAEVTAVCSTAKTELVRSIGADHVIDYTRYEFADGRNRYDVILDIAGNRPLSQLRQALTPRGTLVIVGAEDAGNWLGIRRQLRAAALSPFVRQKLGFFISKERSQDLEELRTLLEAGAIRPVVDKTSHSTRFQRRSATSETATRAGRSSSPPEAPRGRHRCLRCCSRARPRR
jgi:NADPH:quinone reductase-like Zn-dependent oxidoreductase